jgi:hypothetical protein
MNIKPPLANGVGVMGKSVLTSIPPPRALTAVGLPGGDGAKFAKTILSLTGRELCKEGTIFQNFHQ